MHLKERIKSWQIVLALTLIVLTGCCGGAESYQKTKIEVSPEFLDALILEQDGVSSNYPNTATVVGDWIMQNEPD